MGPISLKNYSYRAEAHCAERSGARGSEHPTITLRSSDFAVWFQYCERHLGGLPWAMRALCTGRIESMTVPEQLPMWFDPSFEPLPNYHVDLSPFQDPKISAEEDERMRRKTLEVIEFHAAKRIARPRREAAA